MSSPYSSDTTVIVGSRGPTPCDVMLVGEAPGAEEYRRGLPFVGDSGREQDWYIRRNSHDDVTSSAFYCTNLVKTYLPGNPDPTPELIAEWTPILLDEIGVVRPKLIIPVGRFAVKWFLGDRADMRTVHGIPTRAGAFDATLSGRGNGAIIVPCYHPAWAMRDENFDKRPIVDYDYYQAMKARRVLSNDHLVSTPDRLLSGLVPSDPYKSGVDYARLSGRELAEYLSDYHMLSGLNWYLELGQRGAVLSIDTEGDAVNPWSIQVSLEPDTGYSLRSNEPDFKLGINAIQLLLDNPSVIVVIHNALHDIPVMEAMGLDLATPRAESRIVDNMYLAFRS